MNFVFLMIFMKDITAKQSETVQEKFLLLVFTTDSFS